jgi:hypothetical protein
MSQISPDSAGNIRVSATVGPITIGATIARLIILEVPAWA